MSEKVKLTFDDGSSLIFSIFTYMSELCKKCKGSGLCPFCDLTGLV